ncbi:hypothetical protein OIU77_022764 [Salix suchowensis]|uniref:Uncharacterized protein n=1 Tax=Salix suchowensis TaxID=1278906 RepID=A0ABQ9C1F3_9ROSI|nr:hypothetical protein OIU77_022764 [Salix suchowensis]
MVEINEGQKKMKSDGELAKDLKPDARQADSTFIRDGVQITID